MAPTSSHRQKYFVVLAILTLIVSAQRAAEAREDSPHAQWENLAQGMDVEFSPPPTYPETSDAGDAQQLVDGRISSKRPLWYDKATVGWGGKPDPVSLTIDLGGVQPIRGVALRMGAGQAGADWPKQIRLLVSDDGQAFSLIGDVMKLSATRPPATGYDVVWLQATNLKTHARFVKFIIAPNDTGHGCYVFLDEIEIYKGDAAFLKLPLPEPEGTTSSSSGGGAPGEKQNIAAGKPVTFDAPPNYPVTTDDGDAKQVTDGAFSSSTPIWNDKTTVGWVGGNPAVFTIDLGQVQPIRGAGVHFAAGSSGVEWPASIQMFVSATGEKYSPVGDLMQLLSAPLPAAKEYAAAWLATDKLETHGRYVKFICTPRNLGNGAYIFMDEVEIHRGDDAWLSRPLAASDAPQQWSVDWPSTQWQDHATSIADAERPARIITVDGKSETGADAPLQQATVGEDGVTFTLLGEASKPRSMEWSASLAKPVSTENCRYAVMTFRADGIRRTYEPKTMVSLHGISNSSAENAVTLLEANMALNDGRSHTLVKQLPAGFILQQFKVAIFTEDDAPRLTLEKLEFVSEPPQIYTAEISADQAPSAQLPAGFASVDLGASLNGSLAQWHDRVLSTFQTTLDGVRTLGPGIVNVSGVPFAIASGEKNLAMMPESQPAEGQVEFLGHPVDRKFLEPESRHDTLSVNVNGGAQAREAFLLLALSANPVQRLGGQPHTALRLDDVEILSIELTYDQGESEIAVPYSLADQGCYIPARELGAYAVAVDPSRKLKTITLHNRQFGPNFALAAVTLNTSATPRVPELAQIGEPQRTRQNPAPAEQALSLTHANNRVSIKNQWYECEIDLTHGFVIDKYVNRWNAAAPIELSDSAGLRVRVGNTVYTGRSFAAKVMRVAPNSVELKLTSHRRELPLQILLTITAGDSPELRFVAQSSNTGAEAISPELCVPAIDGMTIGDLAQTSIFFPQYRNVITDQPIALRAPYGPEYTTQFMDIFSRPAGVGVTIRTDNAEQQMAHFALRKDDRGASGGVCFPADYNQLAPSQSRTHIPVSLIAHAGDWRTAVAQYREWVRTWHKPYRSQDKDYLINAWEVGCYRTSDVISWQDTKVAPFINAERTKWMTDEVFEFEKKAHGHLPDFVHFFNWTYNDKKKRNEYGVHGSDLAYEQVGGIEFFRKGIDDMQTRLNMPVSLYTLPDRFRASAVPDQELVKELVANAWHQEPDKDSDASSHLRASGQPDGIYFTRFGHPRWTEYVINDIVKMQRDTGCKLVYIDVFAFWSHLKGHNGVSPRQADLMLLKRLREMLPPDVALWSEYPVTDVASQWHDGALQYYFLHLNEVFARRYNDSDRAYDGVMREMPISISRFVLPRYKNIGLTAYIEAGNNPSQPDAMFVNGEANQEDTWRLHHSRIREKLNRGYDVKRAYNDCFNSDNPSPQVDTATRGIIANEFPGENRTLWTLFNALPKTYNGIVLEIPHKDGATYRDVWNDKEISPTIENGIAKLAVRIDPQQPGCIVQEWK